METAPAPAVEAETPAEPAATETTDSTEPETESNTSEAPAGTGISGGSYYNRVYRPAVTTEAE